MFLQTNITSVFLIFNLNPFLLLSSSSFNDVNNFYKSSSFSAINTVSSAYLKLFKLCPPTLIPGYPSKFHVIISL